MAIILILIIIILTNVLLYLVLKVARAKQLYNKNIEILRRITSCINSVRYGNFSERLEIKSHESEYNNLIESVNRMIETLADRETMIAEYQKWIEEKNRTLEQLMQKEHESKTLRKDFVATLGHDLKVPIIAEANTVELLLDGYLGTLNEKQTEALEKLRNSNKELIELVETILETYKVEDSLIALDKTIISLNQILAETVADMEAVGAPNNQRIELHIHEDIQIYLDPYQMKRVFKNLLINALSFSPRDYSVIVDAWRDGEKAFIKITDFGAGIDAEHIEHIFDKYFSAGKKFRKVGTGLGLYLADEIVKAHDGVIKVESTPYERTMFTVELPF